MKLVNVFPAIFFSVPATLLMVLAAMGVFRTFTPVALGVGIIMTIYCMMLWMGMGMGVEES